MTRAILRDRVARRRCIKTLNGGLLDLALPRRLVGTNFLLALGKQVGAHGDPAVTR
jgi:hypothetical protein